MAIIKEMKFTVSSVIENLTESGLTDGDPERTQISPDGFFKIDGEDMYSISYLEMTEGGKIVSDITVSGKQVTVKRRGAVTSDMVFSEGETHESLYSVGQYSFDTVIFTRKIRNNLTRYGGTVDIFYNMRIGGADKSVRMKIECKEKA